MPGVEFPPYGKTDIGEHDVDAEKARAMLGPEKLLGVSTHNAEQLAAVRHADYAGLGPMFSSNTKHLTRTPGGPALVRSIQGVTDLPVFPIGGITVQNIVELIEAGATRVAVGYGICDASDPHATAAELRAFLTN